MLYSLYRRFTRLTHAYERRFTGTGRIVVAAAVAAAIFGIDTEQTTAYQAFAFLVSLIVLALLFAPFFRSRFAVTRDLPRFGTAGVPLEYRIMVRNLGSRREPGLTLFEDIDFAWPTRREFREAREPNTKRNRIDEWLGFYRWMWLLAERRNAAVEPVDLPTLPAGGVATATLSLTPRRRGVVRLSGASIARPDPLGLFRAFTTVTAPQSLLVLPHRYRLPALRLPGARRYQPGGAAQAGSVGDSEEFIGLRDYQPGDPLQRVHWKSFARVGHPVVKEYHEEYLERHVLALDTAPSDAARFEEAVSIAASFVYTLDTHECLLDLVFIGAEAHGRAGAPAAHQFTAGRGLLHAEHLLEVLAGVRPHGAEALERLRTAVIAQAAELASCILVLAAWDEARRELVDSLRRSGLQLLVIAVVDADADETIDATAGVHRIRVGHAQQDLACL